MPEAVRLVIWDLDETFWRGTLTEGGVALASHNAEIVRELARRGILSSICSKNDLEPVEAILKAVGIRDYFVFPSVNWEAKGHRVAAIIEAVQLRPASAMFIDDNPRHLAEAAALLPDLQTASPDFIPDLLADPRFAGKSDPGLWRLKHYKLLETRHADAQESGGANSDFLRQSDIRVHFEYDVDAYVDRAVELINRTNQLNFTKWRLPEDSALASETLRAQIRPYHRQAALIRVVDKYGDHGFVGFFLKDNFGVGAEARIGALDGRLLHYCFSCRTLGMSIEKWIYARLGRPKLDVVGEVATDIFAPESIDWLRLGGPDEEGQRETARVAPRIVVWGGCESHSISQYLANRTDDLRVHGNTIANGLMFRVNDSAVFASMADRSGGDFAAEAERLGVPKSIAAVDPIEDAPEGSLYILNLSLNALNLPLYRHKRRGWMLHLEIAFGGLGSYDLDRYGEAELRGRLDATAALNGDVRDHIFSVWRHVRENYESVRGSFGDAEREESLRQALERLPLGSRCVVTSEYHKFRWDRELGETPELSAYAEMAARVCARYPHVAFLPHAAAIASDDEVQHGGGSHYDRVVYQRFAEKALAVASALPGRAAAREMETA